MNLQSKKRENRTKMIMYMTIYAAFQIILCIYALMNDRMDPYLGLILVQWILGFGGIWLTVKKEGNAKLVMYTGMLLSVGQLIQSIIQNEAGYAEYQRDYMMFILLAAVGCIVLYVLYRKCFHLLYNKLVIALLCLVSLGIILILKSPLGYEQNGARLWLNLKFAVIQLSEFIKPLLVVSLAGILCLNKKVNTQVFVVALGYTGIVSGLCVILLNEFGTGMILAFTGLVMIYVLQNTKTSKMIIGLIVAGIIAVFVCFLIGDSKYKKIPLEVSPVIFAEEFAACADKSDLVELLNNYTEKMSDEELAQKEAAMDGVTYTEICSFLTYQIQNREVDTSYPEASQEGLTSIQKKYVGYLTLLAEDDTFCEKYNNEFIQRKIYQNRMMAAYTRNIEENAEVVPGFLGKICQKIEKTFLKGYFRVAEKLQNKFSGFLDPKGESKGNAYQINQGMAAMSTGGLFGNGALINKGEEGRIFAFDSDMVFSMVVAELGFVMGLLVIVLNMLIFQEMIYTGLDASTLFQKGICFGMGFSWIIQAFLIVAGNCRIIPFTGITLPLISTGGTSLVICLMMVFLVLLISIYPMQRKKSKGNTEEKIPRKKIYVELKSEEEHEEEEPVVPTNKTLTYTRKEKQTEWKEEPEEDSWENPLRDE